MANEVLEKEALLNSLPVQPAATPQKLETFKDLLSEKDFSDIETETPASHRILNWLLYAILAFAALATLRILWSSMKEVFNGF